MNSFPAYLYQPSTIFFISHDSSAQELSREIKKNSRRWVQICRKRVQSDPIFWKCCSSICSVQKSVAVLFVPLKKIVAVLFVPFEKMLQFYLFRSGRNVAVLIVPQLYTIASMFNEIFEVVRFLEITILLHGLFEVSNLIENCHRS